MIQYTRSPCIHTSTAVDLILTAVFTSFDSARVRPYYSCNTRVLSQLFTVLEYARHAHAHISSFSRTSAAAFEPDPPVFYFKNGTAGVAARFSLFKMALPAWLPLNLFGFRHSYYVLDQIPYHLPSSFF